MYIKEEFSPQLLNDYPYLPGVYDEIFKSNGTIHSSLDTVVNLFNDISLTQFRSLQRIANTAFRTSGITFTVYSDKRGTEKVFPFDILPRIIAAQEWKNLEKGLEQRILALNAFLSDIYGEQKIIQEKRIPLWVVESSKGYNPKLKGITPPGNVYIHIAGIDIIRGRDGKYVVLEDNLRTPSGVSYVLENRFVMKRVFPNIFAKAQVQPVDEYPIRLRKSLGDIAPHHIEGGITVLLTPGAYNSAYFEHTFLARKMGCELVQGTDLFVHQDKVFLKTTRGPKPVSVVYRRLDDAYLDPEVFNNDSLLGVPGIMRAYAAGNVLLANAVGNGIADDKAIYPYVPEMIRFYLSEEPILQQVPTYSCADENQREYVLQHLDQLVVKTTDDAGGYGMLIGPQATSKQLKEFSEKIKSAPRSYIAQPLVELSTCPTFTGKNISPRRVDFRPFIITGVKPWVLPGGLTRVALVENSYIVNSSQGGGSKDTWVLS